MLQPPTGEKRVPTIGNPHGEPAKPLVSRRERRLLMLGVFALAFVIVWVVQGRPRRPDGLITPAPHAVIEPMARPDLAQLAALPDAADIAGARSEVERVLNAGEVPAVGLGIGPTVMAWAERMTAEDTNARRMPQRITVEDVVHDQIRKGQLVVLRGRLVDLLDASVSGREEGGYRWLSIALENDQYVLALGPAKSEELVLNSQVQILGRYLGRTMVPTAAEEEPIHSFFARVVVPVTAESNSAPSALSAFQGTVQVPENLYDEVSDELPIIETRPYYITLGQVKTETGTPEITANPLDANKIANDIHQAPNEYRGKLMRVHGVVYDAWEDRTVALDRPYDIGRVVRVQLYRRDTGPITVDGVTSNKAVLRVYEIAAISDAPLPKTGEPIVAIGRFVKWRAIPVNSHPEMDRLLGVNRQSNKVYTLFLVTGPWEVEPIPVLDWTPVLVILGGLGLLFCVLILWYVNRDRGAERQMRDSVTALRRRRRELARRSDPPPPADPT